MEWQLKNDEALKSDLGQWVLFDYQSVYLHININVLSVLEQEF